MPTLLAVAALAPLLLAPPSAALVASAGVSGQCYDASGQGGHDSLRVTLDTEGASLLAVKLLTVTGALGAALQFAQGNVATPGSLGAACTNQDTLDYVEADASVAGVGIMVCYQGSVVLAGCPTTPPGPGQPG